MTRHGLLLAVACLAVLAGCAGIAGEDRIGYENGYAWDDSLNVTQADGLNATEREAVLARTMARLEHLRGLEFTESVDIRLESREAFRENQSSDPNATHAAWNNQVWEALWLVGGDRDVHEVFDEAFGTRVAGYYSPGSNEVVIVTDSETPRISRSTLVHELVHALQDQQFGLDDAPDRQDAQLARNGVVEGEANRLQTTYARRCADDWECLAPGGVAGGGGSLGPYGENVFTVIFFPYAQGPDFVGAIADRGGNAALDDLYDPYPTSTTAIIHPETYPGESPVDVTVPDRSRGDWGRFDHDPVADTAGEASIFAMVQANDLGEVTAARYSYSHPVSTGWVGDSLVPYRDGDRYGYVWTTAWDARTDAEDFHAAYEQVLREAGARGLDGNRYRLPADHPWGGGYRLALDGRRVTVVHGPTTAALDRIHPP